MTSGAGEFLDIRYELDEDLEIADVENSAETERDSTVSTKIRPVPPPALCGIEEWEVDSNDLDLFADE